MAETVTVICRLPSGIKLDIYDMGKMQARQEGDNLNMKVPAPVKSVTLNGINKDPRFHTAANIHLGMGGRTQVDAAFWNAWFAQNANSELVRKNAIFAEKSEARACERLATEGLIPTGLEPKNPTALPDVKSVNEKPQTP